MARKIYPSDVSDEEWGFVAPYLTLMNQDAPQRKYALRDLFDALRWMVRSGSTWRMLPGDFPPWEAVYQQMQRWIRAECFDECGGAASEAIVHDLRETLRVAQGRDAAPSAAILDSRTLRSTPESGARAGYDGHKKTKGSKIHIAVDTLGHLLALLVSPANEQDRAQVAQLAERVQEATGRGVEIAFVDQGYTGEKPAQAAQGLGIELFVVKLEQAKRGFVLLPKRWIVERDFAWASRFRRLARDYERLPQTLAGLHFLAFAILMLAQAVAHIIKTTT